MPDLVALQTLLPQIDSPDAVAGKALKIQQLQAAQQTAQAEAQARQLALQDDQGARAAFAANPTDGAARLSALAGVSPKLYDAEATRQATLGKTQADTQKSQLEVAKQKTELAGQAFGYVRNNPTPDNAMQAINWLTQNGVYTPEQAQEHLEKIRSNPGEIANMANQAYAGALSTKDQLMKLETRDTGGQMQTIGTDPITGKVTTLSSLAKTQTPDSIASNERIRAEGEANRRSQQNIAGARLAYDKQKDAAETGPLSAADEKMAQGIAAGKLPTLSSFAMLKPANKAIMARALDINPNYDAGDYLAKNKALRDFSTGTQGLAVQAANTGLNHLQTIEELAKAQKNGDIRSFNAIANRLAAETGSAAPTNLAAAVTMVAPEVSKMVIGAAGGQEERATFAKNFNPNASPDQTIGGIGTIRKLLGGRLTEAERTYKRTTGRKNFSDEMLSPAAQAVLHAESPAASAPGAPAAPKAGTVVDGYRFKGGDPAKQSSWEKQ